MRHLTYSVRHFAATSAWVAFVVVTAGQAAAQADNQGVLQMSKPIPETQTVLPMLEAGDAIQVTVGHSRLLVGDRPFGTIIVGDDTIAGASLGPGESIILTGLAAGSTNMIVLDESQEAVLSARIAVVPVTGPLRSTVTVLKGAETRETYECRGESCQRMAGDDEQREFPFVFVTPSEAAPEAEPVSQ